MKHKLNMMILLLIFALIDRSLSAVFLQFEKQMPRNYYFNSRDASRHRGLLFSFLSTTKNEICQDLFVENFDELTKRKGTLPILLRSGSRLKITDEDTNKGEPKHSLIVGRISVISQLFRPNETYEDIFFKCSLYKDSAPSTVSGEVSSNKVEFYVSWAFQSGIMYVSTWDYTYPENVINVALTQYMLTSPEIVSLEQNQLEMKYVMTRKRMMALEMESKKYVELIEQRDDISELTPWQTFILCSSIIYYRNKGRNSYKFSIDGKKLIENALKKDVPRFENKRLVFQNGDLKNEKWTADCVNCWSTAEVGIFSKTINLYFTRSNDDKHSVYVLTEKNGNVYLNDYIKNVPILMNVRVPITDDPPTNKPEPGEFNH